MAAFQVNDKWGFINKEGKVVIKPIYNEVSPFVGGLASVSNGRRWSYINSKGDIVIGDKFNVREKEPGKYFAELAFNSQVYMGDKIESGFFDRNGDLKFSCQNGSDFKEGFAAICIENKWGFIDTTGTIRITPKYMSVLDGFSQGLCGVYVNHNWGFIDKTGDIVIVAKYEEVHPFQEDIAPVLMDGKWGFVDRLGNLIIANKFDNIQIKDLPVGFINGLCLVGQEHGWGYINKLGQYVWRSKR